MVETVEPRDAAKKEGAAAGPIMCVLPQPLLQHYEAGLKELQKRGWRVVHVHLPTTALSQLSVYRPSIVILALSMPGGMDGLEFVALLYKRFPQLGVPTVVLPDPKDPLEPLICVPDRTSDRYSVEHYAGTNLWNHIAELLEPATPVRSAPVPRGASEAGGFFVIGQDEVGDIPPAVSTASPAPADAPTSPTPTSEAAPSAPIQQAPPQLSAVAADAEPLAQAPAEAPPAFVQPVGAPEAARKRQLIIMAVAAVAIVVALVAWRLLASPAAPRAAANPPAVPAPAASAPTPTTSAPTPAAPTARPMAAQPELPTGLGAGKHVLPLRFEKAKDTPIVTDDAALGRLIADLQQTKRCTGTLVGHASAEGAPHVNLELGRRRARAARALLYERGLPRIHLNTDSRGSAEPLVDATTEEGASKNRRVQLEVRCPP